MTETLYRPYAAPGTHFCESRDNDGWLKGSTLDDETNTVHGTLNLEPVEIDLCAKSNDNTLEAAVVGAVVSVIILKVWENRYIIATWFNERVITPVAEWWNKRTGNNPEKSHTQQDNSTANDEDYKDCIDGNA